MINLVSKDEAPWLRPTVKMTMCMTLVTLSLLIAGLVLPRTAHGSILIDSNSVQANARFISDTASGTVIPASELLSAEDSDGYSKIEVEYTNFGRQTVLSYGLDQKRGGQRSEANASAWGTLLFTANANTTYDLAGWFNVTAGGSFYHGDASFRSVLKNVTTGVSLSESSQRSISGIPGANFVLGGSQGSFNFLTGSLTGNLVSGDQYEWAWYANLTSRGDDGASALGNLTLTIDAATVPEPTTFVVWSLLGLTITGASSRWRRG